jgi:1-aminocyclopropane-1-carboxylate deaminase/D-cysteine desulfhydrase-like pyridoxal-dependent ACC family enzyme
MQSLVDAAWNLFLNPPVSPLTHLENNQWQKKRIQVFLKRDDLLFIPTHPEIAGNKWRKLWGTFAQYDRTKESTLISQGGIHSNHLIALAAAGHLLGVKTTGLVRGESSPEISPTLQKALHYGMKLHFISRHDYKSLTPTTVSAYLPESGGPFHFIPEGGSNEASALGMATCMNEIIDSFPEIKTHKPSLILTVPVGTGGTLRGISLHNKYRIPLFGIYVLKGFSENHGADGMILNHDFHLGGYARYHEGLIAFIQHFYLKHHIILDPIYSGKMMFALNELIERDYFKPGTTLIAIHTGGLQGIEAFNKRYRTELPMITDASYPP